jgi:hypothetical protein
VTRSGCSSTELVARIVRQSLREGSVVEIDGLGTFRPLSSGGFRFLPCTSPKIFIAYVEEDRAAAAKLYDGLQRQGFEPWMDIRRLLPGQNWPRAIEHAISVSDFFIACFSRRAVSKRGYFQSELHYALDCATRLPLDDVFLLPARLDDCPLPDPIRRRIQYVDLFPDWQRGFRRLVAAIRRKERTGRQSLRKAG